MAYSVLASSFASKREKVFGYAETASGIGLLAGPIIGEFGNNYLGGYFPSFLCFAGLLSISGLLNLILLPSFLNRKPTISNEEFESLPEKTPVQVQYSWFFKNRRALFALFSLTMVNFFVNFKQSFMTPFLEESKRVDQENLGKVVALPALFMVICTTFIGGLLNRAPKRVFILLSFVLLTISNLLMAPSPTLKLSEYFNPLFFVGLAINGIG